MCEGLLLARFSSAFSPSECDLLLFTSCGLQIATALANTRLLLSLETDRHYFQHILDQLPEGVMLAEATSGIIRYTNNMASQILGIERENLTDLPLHVASRTFQHLARQPEPFFFWTFAVIRALAGETLNQIETVVVRPDGSQVPVSCSSAPLRPTRGEVTGAVLVLRDMTHQKHLEHHKNAFLALASHELRTPLTAILGYAEIIEHLVTTSRVDSLNAEALVPAAHHILFESEQMAYLIDEMLDLSSLDQDQLTLHLTWNNLVQLLEQVIEAQQLTTKKHQLRLTLAEEVRTNGCNAHCDRIRITQVMSNLIANAIKYSTQGGDIEIGLRPEGQINKRALIWVKDHGPGIAQEDLPHLFERFYRSQRPDQSIGGLGIGLYLVKQIIARHNGHIWVESTEGATFYITLPLA